MRTLTSIRLSKANLYLYVLRNQGEFSAALARRLVREQDVSLSQAWEDITSMIYANCLQAVRCGGRYRIYTPRIPLPLLENVNDGQ